MAGGVLKQVLQVLGEIMFLMYIFQCLENM